jgi:Lon protease-like protein
MGKSEEMTGFAMFPLGSVLFPHMPLPLRVFEERYMVMLAGILQDEPSEFGVVLIERGQEVGGGEKRFTVGTIARIVQLEAGEGFIALLAQGDRRLEVAEWLDDDPYPRADIRFLDDLRWDDALADLFESTERTVRRALAIASEFVDQPWAVDVELSDDQVAASWQLAAIAPLGELDQVELLRSATLRDLLESTASMADAATETMRSFPPESDDTVE